MKELYFLKKSYQGFAAQEDANRISLGNFWVL